MRLTAPAIGGAAIALAAALVWYFRPGPAPRIVHEDPASAQSTPAANEAAARVAELQTPAVERVPAATVTDTSARTGPTVERAPLPGEVPPTPMANLLAGRDDGPPPELIEGEREFAAEPVDRNWAPGAEADLLAKFAQMPGLSLIDLQVECRSTMCRLQLTQPSGAPRVEGGPRPFSILLDDIGLEPRWMMAIGRNGEPMRSVAYLWRDGFAPPKPEAGQPHETN